MRISVIICTYNPAGSTFLICLKSIQKALEKHRVLEVIIVDNNSSPQVNSLEFVKTLPDDVFRVVNEEQQGLTPARLRGIREAKGELLVFIDDDNFIAEDFFAAGVEIAKKNPLIGAFSGQVILDFEESPPQWSKKYWGLLVYREFTKDLWSNLPHLTETMPCGAGLFARREVSDHYLFLNETGKRNIQMDRSGKSFFSGGDNDLAACACDIGMGVGLFHKLTLRHFIPKERVSMEYLLKLAHGISASSVVFRAFRNDIIPPVTTKNRVANIIRRLLMNEIERKFFDASLEGEETGRKILEKNFASYNEYKI